MRILICIISIFFLFNSSFAQTDSLENNIDSSLAPSRKLKRGFYMSYDEFLNNSPSVIKLFTTIKKTTSKKKIKNGIYRVSYELASGEKPIKGRVWGFSDDTLFYVNIYGATFRTDFWKLECTDCKFPFAYVNTEHGLSPFFGGIVDLGAALISDAAYPTFNIYIIKKNGSAQLASGHVLRKLFASAPDILKAYDEDTEKESDIIKEYYLIKFNQYMSTH